MNELARRVERIRAVLAQRPDGIMLGDFPSGRVVPGNGLPPGLADVLVVTDGPRGGDIVMYSHAELAQQHLPLDGITAIPDEEAGMWLRFGALNYEPLLVHRHTGEVWWFPDTGVQWFESEEFRKLTDNVEKFCLDYLLGAGYLDICVAGDDDWARLLIELGWADRRSPEE
ncbi:hypothetical protein [Micromonospora sp. HM5-17]|uniref:hypothetical protein n=1 Tax=Micromonospora sp. HM5-17 TaxID=2487710 RepID=UPI000F4755FD|nr:hypothetical protein [Micromonospora sp. HM5-17]ROT32972.1 hypothetical protein EF879_07400 [Micromonospora sp. HM5-17]